MINLYGNKIWFIFIIVIAAITGIAITYEKWLYAGLIVIPLLVYLSIIKPFFFPFGLYAILLPIDSTLSLTGGHGATLTKYLGIITILALIVKGGIEKKFKRPDSAVLWWILFIMYGILSFFWANDPQLTISRIQTAVGLLILYLLLSSYKIKEDDFIVFKWCVFIGGLLAAIVTIYGYLENPDIRATYGVANPNTIAFALSIPVSVCINLMIREDNIIKKYLIGFSLGVMIFGIIVTGSRGGFLGVVAILITYLYSARQKIALSITVLILGIMIVSILPDLFFDRWGSASETGGAGRTDIWYIGWKALINKYWLFGTGLDNFQSAYDEFIHYSSKIDPAQQDVAHNMYLGFSVELGVIGISLFVFAIVKHYKAISVRFSENNIDSVMLKASFWSVLINGMFQDIVWRKTFWLLWIMIMMYRTFLNTRISETKHL